MANLLDNLEGIPGADRIQKKSISRRNEALKQNSTDQNTDKVVYINGISGVYKGKRIIIHDGDTYTFGRSPKNQIQFGQETRGVSRLHLSIRSCASEKKVILVDHDSSYGTYDASKRRYVSNYPYELHEGDTISFGYNEMFKVEFE